MSTETPLGLIVPVDADAPNGPAQIGGNAEKADALLQAGGVAKHFESHGAALTRASTAIGAFSTPIAVTLPKVKVGQIIEVVGYFSVTSSIASPQSGASGARIAYNIGGTVWDEQGIGSLYALEIGAGTFVGVHPAAAGWSTATSFPDTPANRLGAPLPRPQSMAAPFRYVVGADATNVVVELQGCSKSSGTITVEGVIWVVHVYG